MFPEWLFEQSFSGAGGGGGLCLPEVDADQTWYVSMVPKQYSREPQGASMCSSHIMGTSMNGGVQYNL